MWKKTICNNDALPVSKTQGSVRQFVRIYKGANFRLIYCDFQHRGNCLNKITKLRHRLQRDSGSKPRCVDALSTTLITWSHHRWPSVRNCVSVFLINPNPIELILNINSVYILIGIKWLIVPLFLWAQLYNTGNCPSLIHLT